MKGAFLTIHLTKCLYNTYPGGLFGIFAMSSAWFCHYFFVWVTRWWFSPSKNRSHIRIQVLSSGTWSNPSSDLLPQPRGLGAVTPGPLTMDETVSLWAGWFRQLSFHCRVTRALRLWTFEWWQWTWRIDIFQNLDSVWSGEALLLSIHSSCTRKINLQGVKPFKTPQTSETSWYLESLRTCWFSKFGDWIAFFAQLIQKNLNFLDGQQPITLSKGSKEYQYPLKIVGWI